MIEQPQPWELLSERVAPMKNIGGITVREIVNSSIRMPSQSAEDRAREGLADAYAARRAADGSGSREAQDVERK